MGASGTVKPEYYADCRPHEGGCRNCGEPPAGRFRFYCGAECRDVFEPNHFWSNASRPARWAAIDRASIFRPLLAGHRAKKADLSDENIAWQQRRRGIIGPDGTCEALRAVELLYGMAEPIKVRQVALA